jgi:hypothetical protein
MSPQTSSGEFLNLLRSVRVGGKDQEVVDEISAQVQTVTQPVGTPPFAFTVFLRHHSSKWPAAFTVFLRKHSSKWSAAFTLSTPPTFT